jgi:uncharacterized SAM-binding protein YcdF (DUF218 family)
MEPKYIDAINTLSTFLALRTIPSLVACPRVSAIVVCGSAVLATVRAAVEALQLGVAPLILFSGGVGHSTPLLYAAVAADPVLAGRVTVGALRSEAAVLRDVALALGAPPAALLVEEASTNCGANAALSRAALAAAGLPAPAALLLIQDPTMQRRTHASFERAFRDAPDGVALHSWAPFVPRARGGGARSELALEPAGVWADDRFLELLLGEVPRLRDAPHGYGPNGAGFIAHVDIPCEVENAHGAVEAAAAGGAAGCRAVAPVPLIAAGCAQRFAEERSLVTMIHRSSGFVGRVRAACRWMFSSRGGR